MTNSEKQTKNMAKRRGRKTALPKAQVASGGAVPADETSSEGPSSEGVAPAYATRGFWQLVLLALLVMGMVFSLQINSWHFTVPVVVLWLGWAGVLATVGFIWAAGLSITGEGSGDRMAPLDVSEARRHELEAEKKSLIQAIKEIEFDRDLGKMSEEDATEMMKYYRARAIEVIKELDGQLDEELNVSERVKRDLEARLAVASQGRKRTSKSAVVKKKPTAKSNVKSKTEDEDESKPDSSKPESSEAASDEESDSTEPESETSSTNSAENPDSDSDTHEESAKSADSNVKESA